MDIVRADLYRVTQRSRVDTITARGSRTQSPEVFLKLTEAGGATGWGAAAPKWYITGESQDSVIRALQDRLIPPLLESSTFELEGLTARLDGHLRYNQAAKTAVDIALHDLTGRMRGLPVYELLGGKRPSLDLTGFEVLFMGTDRDTAVETAQAALSRGYRNLKIKAGSDVAEAVERATSIRKALGPAVRLIIDANQSWGISDAMRAAPALALAGVDEVEQPLGADAVAGLAALSKRFPIPITVDESVCTERECMELLRARAVQGIVLKVAKLGGLQPCRRIADLSAQSGVYCIAGATLQSALLEAATAHLFMSTENIVRHEVKLLVEDDVACGPRIQDGLLLVDAQPGLGTEVDETRLGAAVASLSRPRRNR